MTLAASGIMSKMLERARVLLKNVSAWQTWSGHAGDAAGADGHIYEFELRREIADARGKYRPFCIIDLGEVHQVGTSGMYAARVAFRFEADVSAEYLGDPSLELREFNNNLSAVVVGMNEDAEADVSGTKLAVRLGEERVDGPFHNSEIEEVMDGSFLFALVELACGPDESGG